MRMIRLIAIMLAITLVPALAGAVTFSGGYTVSANGSEPGFAVNVDPTSLTFPDFDLADGQSAVGTIFRIWTDETAVNADDVAGLLTVAFTFTAPPGSGNVLGAVGGVILPDPFAGVHAGLVIFGAPLELDFGPNGSLLIELGAANLGFFNAGNLALTPGRANGIDVAARFTYTAATVVPLPAAAGFLLLGLGTLAGLSRLRRRVA